MQLIPPTVLKLDLKQPMVAPELGRQRMTAQRAAQRMTPQGTAQGRAEPHGGRLGRTTNPSSGAAFRGTSWWTQRAVEAEVAPGFTKENLTRQVKEDPGAKGGLFERIVGLLMDLTD
jgi:hypothetical protein